MYPHLRYRIDRSHDRLQSVVELSRHRDLLRQVALPELVAGPVEWRRHLHFVPSIAGVVLVVVMVVVQVLLGVVVQVERQGRFGLG